MNTKHGLYKHPLYKIWLGMKRRCYNSKNDSYKYYGARGVRVCSEWKSNFVRSVAGLYWLITTLWTNPIKGSWVTNIKKLALPNHMNRGLILLLVRRNFVAYRLHSSAYAEQTDLRVALGIIPNTEKRLFINRIEFNPCKCLCLIFEATGFHNLQCSF